MILPEYTVVDLCPLCGGPLANEPYNPRYCWCAQTDSMAGSHFYYYASQKSIRIVVNDHPIWYASHKDVVDLFDTDGAHYISIPINALLPIERLDRMWEKVRALVAFQ